MASPIQYTINRKVLLLLTVSNQPFTTLRDHFKMSDKMMLTRVQDLEAYNLVELSPIDDKDFMVSITESGRHVATILINWDDKS